MSDRIQVSDMDLTVICCIVAGCTISFFPLGAHIMLGQQSASQFHLQTWCAGSNSVGGARALSLSDEQTCRGPMMMPATMYDTGSWVYIDNLKLTPSPFSNTCTYQYRERENSDFYTILPDIFVARMLINSFFWSATELIALNDF